MAASKTTQASGGCQVQANPAAILTSVQWTASQQPVLQPPQTKENKKRVQSRFDFPSLRLLMELLIRLRMSCFLFPFPCWIWKEIASEDFFFHCGFASKRKRKHLLRFLSMVWPKEDPFHHALSATLRPMGKDALSTALATCFLRWFQPTARCIARLPKGRSKEAKHKKQLKIRSTLFDNFRKFLTPIGPFLQTDIQHHPFFLA